MEIKHAKIIALQAENVKRIKAIAITPDGNFVQITGANGSGKTSCLDAIWWALAGTSHIQTSPIRKGATEAIIRLDLGEVIVTRKFKAKEGGEYTTSLTVESREGARFPSPQKMLDDLFGELTFDPMGFMRATSAEQFDIMRRFVPDIDFEELDRLQAGDYDKRTDINRDAKRLHGEAAAILVPDGTPDEAIDVQPYQAAADEGHRVNAAITLATDRHSDAERSVVQLNERVADLKAQTEIAEASLVDQEKIVAIKIPDRVDISNLQEALRQVQAKNSNVQQKAERDKLREMAGSAEQASDQLTAAIAARDKTKRDAVADADMPVKGITFGEGEILFNDVPLAQASDAEQLRISVAIAMAANPKLRVIRIRDGSLLDDDGMKTLAKMADDADYQIWIERVDTTGKVGIVMEDGMVKGADAHEATNDAKGDDLLAGVEGEGAVKNG